MMKFLLLFFIFGCSEIVYPCHSDVVLISSPDMYINEKAGKAIYEAAHMWDIVGARIKTPQEPYTPNSPILYVSLEKMKGTHAGYYSENHGYIRIDTENWLNIDKQYNTDKNILAHEIGHAMGLEHVKDPHSLMHWSVDDTINMLMPADFNEFKRVCR